MASNRITVRLDQLGEIVGGATPSTNNPEYWGGDIPWLSPKDLTGYKYRYISRGEKNITEEGFSSCSTKLLPEGSVLFSSRAPIGYCAIAANSVCTNQGFKSIVPKEGVDSEFLYYLLCANRDSIAGAGSGTTFPEVSGKTMRRFEVVIPECSNDQKAIARVLGTLDAKIELNNQINDYLAELQQTIYAEWTSDGEMVTIGEIASVIDCLHSKKPERQNEGKPLIQLNNIANDGILNMQDAFWISESDYEKWISRCEINPGDCVITNVGRIGAVSQAPRGTKAAMGRNMTCIRPNALPATLITALCSKAMRHEIEKRTDSGTIMNALNVRNIPKLELMFAKSGKRGKLERLLKTIQDRREVLLEECGLLTSLRDILLPKLMSGEVDISKVDTTQLNNHLSDC